MTPRKRADATPRQSSKRRAAPAEKDTFFFIPHSHWEGAVFKTRDEYLDIGLPHILQALQLLKEHPDYRYTIDQACYVQPFLQRHPEQDAAFRQFVKEGRLAIVGGTDVMLDVNMPGGESFVRQVLYGKGYFRRELGVEVTTAWQLDTFGHHAQMPQLLKLAGYESFWFMRGVSAMDGSVPGEFLWEGLDGSRIPAVWLAQTYVNLHGSPEPLAEFTAFIKGRYDAQAPFARAPGRVGISGGDVCEPEAHVPALVDQFNRQADVPFRVRLAVPADYEAAVAERPDPPVVTGEMNPIFQGIYSSRIELKQRTRELERLLTTGEKVGVLLHWLGTPVDDDILWQAWEPMLFNQAHDLMSGVMTDGVYEDTIRGYDFSQRIAKEELDARLRSLTAHIDTRGEGIAVVVFNGLGWSRTDVALASVGFTDPDVRDVTLVGPDGQPVPVEMTQAQRHPDGTLIQADIAFVARDVPALGYAVYRVLGSASDSSDPADPQAQQPAAMGNESCLVTCDPATGAITRLVLQAADWDALAGPGNVVAMEKDAGDFWELYQKLDGASRIAMTNRHTAPGPGQATFSTDQSATPGIVHRGPVFSELTVAHPLGEHGGFRTTVRVYAGVRRVEVRTHILNNDRFVRYRVLFPTSIAGGTSVHEIPFGAHARPDGIESPAQNWVDYGDGERGLAVLNRGLPGNNVADGVMMLSLVRSTCIVSYGHQGGYGPGMGSDTGFELGKELAFDYALLPHHGDWRDAGVYREGLAYNHPLIATTARSHPGTLPSRWGFLEMSADNVVVSALKLGRRGRAVLRVYEAAGKPTRRVKVKFAARVTSAREVNLVEDAGRKLKPKGKTLRFDLRPFEIKTFELRVKPKG